MCQCRGTWEKEDAGKDENSSRDTTEMTRGMKLELKVSE